MAAYDPFDPDSDSDQIADRIRRDVVAAILPWLSNPVFANLSPERQLGAVMAGLVTGTICACFSMIHDSPASHAEMIKNIEAYLPQAWHHVEAIEQS